MFVGLFAFQRAARIRPLSLACGADALDPLSPLSCIAAPSDIPVSTDWGGSPSLSDPSAWDKMTRAWASYQSQSTFLSSATSPTPQVSRPALSTKWVNLSETFGFLKWVHRVTSENPDILFPSKSRVGALWSQRMSCNFNEENKVVVVSHSYISFLSTVLLFMFSWNTYFKSENNPILKLWWVD